MSFCSQVQVQLMPTKIQQVAGLQEDLHLQSCETIIPIGSSFTHLKLVSTSYHMLTVGNSSSST